MWPCFEPRNLSWFEHRVCVRACVYVHSCLVCAVVLHEAERMGQIPPVLGLELLWMGKAEHISCLIFLLCCMYGGGERKIYSLFILLWPLCLWDSSRGNGDGYKKPCLWPASTPNTRVDINRATRIANIFLSPCANTQISHYSNRRWMLQQQCATGIEVY